LKPRPTLSEAEMEVLRVLWEQGPATVRQVNQSLRDQGRTWAYTTVQTLLQRLQLKGCVASETSGIAHVFRASASRDEIIRDRLKDVADQLCEGASAPLVLALVEGHRYSADEIARFRALLDRLENKGPSTKS
jgi:BlaI family transcriptional regulator, penicillinase repressor